MAGELAQLNKVRQWIQKVSTVEEAKQVGSIAEGLAVALKNQPGMRERALDATEAFLESKFIIGRLLGPPPGKGGFTRNNKGQPKSHQCDLGNDEVNRCRKVAYRIVEKVWPSYLKWLRGHGNDYPTFADALTLSRLDEDLQTEVITILQRGQAESLAEAIREAKKRNIVEGEKCVPSGEYRTIVIDPPWEMQKISRPEQRPNQEAFDYAGMSVDELKEFAVPAADECHIYLWTTQKYLREAFELLDAWSFKYLVTMVWRKSGGFQPVGLPQYNCEFVLLGRRGGLGFTDTKDFNCCFDGKRREHSRKPAEFYDVVRRVSPAPRINIFSREEIDGFDGFGWEAGKFVEGVA